MIYDRLKDGLLVLLRAPRQPPEAPAGSAESVQVFRAAPNFLVYQLIVWGAGFLAALIGEIIFLAVEVFLEHSRGAELALGMTLLALTLAGSVVKYFLIRLDYDMRYYVVTDRSLRIRQGALFIDESTFTYANVQNLKIQQGPVERLLGISNLEIETAGGGARASKREGGGKSPFRRGHEGVLRGIANARAVRDQVLSLLKRYRDAGLGDPEDRGRDRAARAGESLSPAAMQRLREIRDELVAEAQGHEGT